MRSSTLIVLIFASMTSDTYAAENSKKYHQVLADKCVNLVTSRLHDPAGAKIPSALSAMDYPSKFYVGDGKKGLLTVQFDMQARNGFNAMRRSTAQCEWRRVKDNFVLVSVKSL